MLLLLLYSFAVFLHSSSTKHGLTIKVYDFFADQNATQFPVLLDYDWSMESYSNEASPFDNFDEINASPISPPVCALPF